MSSRKRGAADAGIKIHVKRGEEDDPDVEEMVDEEESSSSSKPPPALAMESTQPLQKRRAGRRLAQTGDGAPAKNMFAGIASQFGQPMFSSTAFSGGSAASGASGSATTSLFSATTTSNQEKKDTNASLFGEKKDTSASLFGASNQEKSNTSLFGNPGQGSLFAAPPTSPPVTSSASLFSSKPSLTSSTSNFGTASGATTGGTSITPTPTNNDESLQKMVALNTSFLSWLENKVRSTPEASLMSGVRMYIDYVNTISTDSKGDSNGIKSAVSSALPVSVPKSSNQESAKSSLLPAASGNSMFAFGIQPDISPAASLATGNESKAPSLFGSSDAKPSLFGASDSKPSLFSTDSKPALFSTDSKASIFGQTSSGGSTTSLFGSSGAPSLFGTSTTSSLFPASGGLFSSANGGVPTKKDEDGEDEEGGDDEVEPAEPTVQAQKSKNENEEVLYEADPCKVLVLKDKEWVSRGGKGRLVITKHKQTGKCRALLRAGTTGNLFFNAPINSTMLSSLTRQKTTVRLVTTSFTVDQTGSIKPDNDGKPTLYAFRTATEDDAEKLRGALESAMKGSQ